MKTFVTLIATALLAGCASTNEREPIVILISIDGLGPPMMQSVDTPVLDELAASGLSAERMQPVFPSLTFPNHYSIATGLYPAEHGIVNNRFPNAERSEWYTLRDRTKVQDGKWYVGEPVWVLAERNGLTSKSYYFVGTEATINGVKPTVAFDFDPNVAGTERVDTVLGWLALPASERPRFVTLYFEDVDRTSHDHGPYSAETKAAIKRVDDYLRRLVDGVEKLPVANDVHYVIVSDHGQAPYLADQDILVLDTVVDTSDARIIEGGAYLNLFDEDMTDSEADAICTRVNRHWQYGSCYTRHSAPAEWRVADDTRYPEVMLVADVGHALISTEDRRSSVHGGDHGWPPEADSMQALFIASGPMIEKGRRVESIHVIDVYPFMLQLLGLEPPREFPDEQQVLLDYIVGP